MPPYDYLIVGHGIAGALLGYLLEQRGRGCCYVDAPRQTSATAVAAGIINPLTGRRFVKSWRIESLLPVARSTYAALERELNRPFYHPQPLLRTLFDAGDENTWLARTGEDGYPPFMAEMADLGALSGAIQPAFGYGQVRQAARVDIGLITALLEQRRREAGNFRSEAFDYEQLRMDEEGVSYRDLSARRVVFAEGWRGRFNPYFSYLPFRGSKGEVLLIHLPDHQLDRIIKHRLFVVPYRDGTYWIGTYNGNPFTDEQPSREGGRYLRERLAEILTVPYEIVDHQAAIRPTVKDRRPFLGRHPRHPALAIFNGLGTKGASLAPYWARRLVSHLEDGAPLDPEVDISRFPPAITGGGAAQ